MSTAPTISQIQSSLLENADFAEANSVSKARAFITACKQFRIANPQSSSNGGTSVGYDIGQVAALQAQAEAFLRANASPSGRVRFLSVSDDFR